MAKQPMKAWIDGCHIPPITRPFQYREGGEVQHLDMSLPSSIRKIEDVLDRENTRWIFTPSFYRCRPGPRQALLDRSAALAAPLRPPDVGQR